MAPRRDISWDEWRQAQLKKAPASGGRQSGINPGFGMMGPGNTSSYAPTGPNYRPSNMQGLPKPQGSEVSQYAENSQSQPPNWIDDVDMETNWYSPFQPIWPYGPPNITRPREWNFPVGYNLNYIQPRMELMQMLRGMRRSWGVLATIEATRQDQLLRIPWTIQLRDKPRQTSKVVDEMRKFFRRPDGKLSYSQWSRKLLFDLFDIDAPTIYFDRNLKGQPIRAEILDGATVFPLIDDAGRRPDSFVDIGPDGMAYEKRQPAFQQIIYGLPMIDLDETQIMYCPMRVQPDQPMFGYSPIEQFYNEIIEAILKTTYQRNFWQEGSIPDLIITVPDQWTPRQIAMFQGHFDALLSGNLNLKSKVRFIPGGMKPFDIKNSSGESLWSQRDELLVRLACYAFSVSPTPFIHQTNRATAQNAQQSAEEEGLYPLMSWWKDDIMDTIIQEKFGYADVEFMFLPRPETDLEKQSKIHDLQLRNASRTINEVRDELGEEPIEGGDIPMIYVGNGAIPLEVAVQGEATGTPDPTSPEDSGSISKPKPAPQTTGPQSRATSRPQAGRARPTNQSPQPQPTSKPTPIHKLSAEQVRAASRGASEDLDTLSPQQINAGNYPKGHISIQGLDISIENQKGSKRGEKTQSGEKEFVRMPAPYGYIRGTIGADKSQLDVYLGKYPNSPKIWVVDQDKVKKKSGKPKGFDEHKIFIGYKKLKKALKDYLASHFDGRGHEKLNAVTELSWPEFKSWLKSGNTQKPLADQGFGDVVIDRDDRAKLQKLGDTISSATNLLSYDQSSATPAPRKRRSRKRRPRLGARWLLQSEIQN